MAHRKNSEVRFLVDYFAFTITRLSFAPDDFDETYIFDRIKKKLYLDGLDYTRKKAWYGYNVNYNCQGVSISFGGRDDIYIQLSGTGCRAFETLNPGMTWEQYISYLQQNYPTLHFSRLDIACDTFDLLRIKTVQNATIAGKYVSKWRQYSVVIGSAENIVYFGSTQSDFRCRIYDKTMERRDVTGRSDIPDNWVRVEFQLRNKSAGSFLDAWQRNGNLSDTFLGMLRNQLNFYTSYDGKNRDRMKLTSWWDELLGNAGRISMAYSGGMEYNFDKLKEYVINQAGASIRTYLDLKGSDELFREISRRPLNDRQRALLAGAEQVDLNDLKRPSFR